VELFKFILMITAC